MTGEVHGRLRRWQEEVARDPGADAFVPLGDLYRAQGRLDAARRVVGRGLERNPQHVEGHYVLGRIHRDAAEPERAYDEWDIALGLDPAHLPSRRALGFLCLERGETAEAARHLLRAAELDPEDPRLRRALARLEPGADPLRPAGDYWELAAPLLRGVLEPFVRESRVRLVLMVDESGQVVAQHGFTRELDVASLATLAAGVHAASGEIARVLGQRGFDQLYQGRGEQQIFLGELRLPRGFLLLLTVFGSDSSIGLVRVLFRELSDRLTAVDWPEPGAWTSAESLEADLDRSLQRALGAATGGAPGGGA